MRFDDQKVIELMLGLIFIALLLIAVVIVLGESEREKSTGQVISNSYNHNSFNEKSIQEISSKAIQENVVYKYDNVVYRKYYYEFENEEDFDYSSYGKHSQRKDFVGTYVDEFYVYVENEGDGGEWFEVKFYFEDREGNGFSRSIRKYVKADQEQKFFYKDVQEEKYKYYDWAYKVFVEGQRISGKYEFDYVYP